MDTACAVFGFCCNPKYSRLDNHYTSTGRLLTLTQGEMLKMYAVLCVSWQKKIYDSYYTKFSLLLAKEMHIYL